MLGLPCAISENNFATENSSAEDTEFEKLERIHIIILGRIIARNVRMQRHRREGNDVDGYDDYKETEDIDYSMKQATGSLPAAWWTSSAFSSGATDAETMDRTAKLLGQMHHYCYLAMLHQPYVVYNTLSQPIPNNGKDRNSQLDYSYNQIAALSASRETLSRFLSLRSFHQVFSYRSLDDKAYLVAIVVILSHINGHRLGRGNVLDHQRPQDLKLLSDVIVCIEGTSLSSKNVLTSITIHNLKKLMEIEADSAKGANYDIWLEEDEMSKQRYGLRKEKQELRMKMPYFGTVCIARQRPINPQPACSSLNAAQAEILTLSTSEILGLTAPQNSSELSVPPQMLDSSYSLLYQTQNHKSQIYTPLVSVQNLSPADKTRVEETWSFEDEDTTFLDAWVNGENQIGDALLRPEE
jgi:hypothetical protein